MESTWETVAVPIMEHVAELEKEQIAFILDLNEVAENLGISPAEAEAEAERLIDAGYLNGHITKTMGAGAGHLTTPRLGPAGARAVGNVAKRPDAAPACHAARRWSTWAHPPISTRWTCRTLDCGP